MLINLSNNTFPVLFKKYCTQLYFKRPWYFSQDTAEVDNRHERSKGDFLEKRLFVQKNDILYSYYNI